MEGSLNADVFHIASYRTWGSFTGWLGSVTMELATVTGFDFFQSTIVVSSTAWAAVRFWKHSRGWTFPFRLKSALGWISDVALVIGTVEVDPIPAGREEVIGPQAVWAWLVGETSRVVHAADL